MKRSHFSNRREFITTLAGGTCLLANGARGVQPGAGFSVEGEQVRGFAVSPTSLLIAVAADRQVDLYDGSGRRTDRHELGRPVRAVAFGAKGRLFAALKDSVAFSDGGCFETFPAKLGRAAVLTSLAVDEAGHVFGADAGNKVVWKLNFEGEVIAQISPGKLGFAVSKAFFPIAWQAGLLWVGEPGRHRVLAFGENGEQVGEWGSRSRSREGFAGCCNPVGLAAVKGGFITAERGLVRIRQFETARSRVSVLAGPEAFPAPVARLPEESPGCEGGGMDVVAEPGGRVLVLDRNARRITVVG